MAQTTHLASFGPFSLFVGFLFPLRRPLLVLWAFMGPRGCRPHQRGVWWVWCSRLSCTVKQTQPPASGGYARVGLLPQVCTGRGYRQAYPHPYPSKPLPAYPRVQSTRGAAGMGTSWVHHGYSYGLPTRSFKYIHLHYSNL